MLNIGDCTRSSMNTKTTSRTMPPTIDPITQGLPQPVETSP